MTRALSIRHTHLGGGDTPNSGVRGEYPCYGGMGGVSHLWRGGARVDDLLPSDGRGWHHLIGGSHNPSYAYPLTRGVMIVMTHHLMYIHVVRYHHLDRGGWVDTPRSKPGSMTTPPMPL